MSLHLSQTPANEATMRRHVQVEMRVTLPCASTVTFASQTHGSSGQGGHSGFATGVVPGSADGVPACESGHLFVTQISDPSLHLEYSHAVSSQPQAPD